MTTVALFAACLAGVQPDPPDLKSIERQFRDVRKAMIRASCDPESIQRLDQFDEAHPRASERLLSPNQLDVCQGLLQVRKLADSRAGPYVAFYMREHGPVGEFAIRAGASCRHPLVIAAAIERLRGPSDIRALEQDEGLFTFSQRTVWFSGGSNEVDPLFTLLRKQKATEAVPTLLGLLKRQGPMQPWRDAGTNRPGNIVVICQTISELGDARASGALIQMLLGTESEDAGGGQFFVGGMDNTRPDPLFQAVLRLTDQRPGRYGLRSGSRQTVAMWGGAAFEEVLAFESEKARTKALEKLRKWWDEHKSEPQWNGLAPDELPELPRLFQFRGFTLIRPVSSQPASRPASSEKDD